MRSVLITGASGFIARHTARACKEQGWKVVGLCRSGRASRDFDSVYKGALGDDLPAMTDGIDVVVHAANDTGPDQYRTNVEGTAKWFHAARERGARLQIFLSSLSSRADATTDYGRAKFALEGMFRNANEVSFRLGVVVGDGGMFERIRRSLSLPIVPLLDGGSARVYVLGVEFLSGVIVSCILSNGEGLRGAVWNLQQPTPHTLRELSGAIKRAYGLRCIFVPVPSLPILWLLSALEKLPLPLPISASNVKGLRQSRSASFPSDFERFRQEPQALDELVARAAELSQANA